MADRTRAERQRRYRDRRRKLGLVPVTIYVPADRLEELHRAAMHMRAEHYRKSVRTVGDDFKHVGNDDD